MRRAALSELIRTFADVAPSILHIMGLEQPKEMTGKCLIMD